MTQFIRKRDLLRRGLMIPVLCCMIISLLVYGYLNVAGFARFCNADVYADTQVAMRMWEQKTLFPEGWQFGNQFYVAATPVLAALMYGLTGSINLGMALATEIAVYSDGKLEAGCWHTPKTVFYVEMANTPQHIYGEAENEKAIYVFTAEDEEAGLRAAQERGVTMEKVAEFGDCRVYTSPVQLMRKWG